MAICSPEKSRIHIERKVSSNDKFLTASKMIVSRLGFCLPNNIRHIIDFMAALLSINLDLKGDRQHVPV